MREVRPLNDSERRTIELVYPLLEELAKGDDDALSYFHEWVVLMVYSPDAPDVERLKDLAEIEAAKWFAFQRRSSTCPTIDPSNVDVMYSTPPDLPEWETFDSLTTIERQVVNLRVSGRLTWEEVAEQVGKTDRQCRRIFDSARQKLRGDYEQR